MSPGRFQWIFGAAYVLLLVIMSLDLTLTWRKEIREMKDELETTSFLLAEISAERQNRTDRSFDSILDDLIIGKQAIVGIVDMNGSVIARKPGFDRHPIGINDVDAARRLVRSLTGPRLYFQPDMRDGYDRWISIRPIRNADLFAFAANTTTDALYGWQRRLVLYLILAILIGVGLIFLYRYQVRLLRSDRKIRTLLDEISEIPVQGYRSDGTVIYWNKASESIYGYTREEMLGQSIYDYIVPDEGIDPIRSNAQSIVTSGITPKAKLWVLKNKSGELMHILTHYILMDEDPLDPQIFCFDVNMEPSYQAQKRIEGLLMEKETVLREVHHRIKNNMSTISGLLWLQAEGLGESPARTALLEAQGRVQNMMVLYNHLYRSDRVDSLSVHHFVTDLIDRIQETLDPGGRVKISVSAVDIQLDAKIMMTVGMILNELLSNIYKYAFPAAHSGGSADITIKASDDGNLHLTIRDSGPGLPPSVLDGSAQGGFGMTLVTMLTEQLGGTCSMKNTPGATFEFRVPI